MWSLQSCSFYYNTLFEVFTEHPLLGVTKEGSQHNHTNFFLPPSPHLSLLPPSLPPSPPSTPGDIPQPPPALSHSDWPPEYRLYSLCQELQQYPGNDLVIHLYIHMLHYYTHVLYSDIICIIIGKYMRALSFCNYYSACDFESAGSFICLPG